VTGGSHISLARHGREDFPELRPLLIDIYAEVYKDSLSDPFFSLPRFSERLESHASAPTWGIVIGYDEQQPVGYAYGAALSAGSAWWSGINPPLDPAFPEETGSRTLALFELMVRQPWRGTGTARLIHDELLRTRQEERVSLGVERDHPKVTALYESWGYTSVGEEQPFPDAPVYFLMWRPIRHT
jgi:GNAT superfamily N-acetyltransferase